MQQALCIGEKTLSVETINSPDYLQMGWFRKITHMEVTSHWLNNNISTVNVDQHKTKLQKNKGRHLATGIDQRIIASHPILKRF